MTDSDNFDLEKQSVSSNDHQDMPRAIQTITSQSFRHDRDNIYINDTPIPKKEFVTAFGGALEVGVREKTTELKEYANPVPAGLAAFSASAMSLGFVHMGARSVSHVNVLLVAFLTTSGLVELIVGILCFIIGNTWAACTFLMFGGFWSSYSFLLMNVGSISEAYSSDYEYNQVVGFYLLPWVIFSFTLWACTLKSTVPLTILMFLIWMFILLLTIGQFIGSTDVTKAGGFFCILAGLFGFYNMFAGFADETNSYFVIKPVFMPHAHKSLPADDE